MKSAFGGIANIIIIAVFFVLVEGILAFTVSYTKAFRMKNNIISTIEEYEGNPTCFDNAMSSACSSRIKALAEQIAYNPSELACHGNFKDVGGMFCYEEVTSQSNPNINTARYKTYRIITQVDVDFPIVNKILGFRFFQVAGDTRLIRLSN